MVPFLSYITSLDIPQIDKTVLSETQKKDVLYVLIVSSLQTGQSSIGQSTQQNWPFEKTLNKITKKIIFNIIIRTVIKL